jgi:hypothetical protein
MGMRAMATAKSDDEAEERQPHPLAQNRPGVYVQVVGTPRKRKAEQARREADAASAPPQAEQVLSYGQELPEQDTARPSGVESSARAHAASAEQFGAPESFGAAPRREEPSGFGSRAEAHGSRSAPAVEVMAAVSGADSENTNHRADLMKVPGPPRMPSISLSGAPLPAKEMGASLLDAPRSLRPDSLPSEKKTSWALLAFVATLSAIITAAAVVAVREKSAPAAHEVRGSAPAQKIDQAGGSIGPLQVEPARVPSTEPAPSAAPVQQPAEAAPVAAAPESEVAPAVPAPVPAQQHAAPSVAPQPIGVPNVQPEAAPTAPAAAVAVQPLHRPAPALAPRRPAAAPAQQGSIAPKAAPSPAQIIAEHARTLAPVELPAATDTSLPANPYEPPAGE